MNADLHMADDLKNTGKGNLFVIFGEPDIDILPARVARSGEGQRRGRLPPQHRRGPQRRPEGIACWFIDTDYNEESFFVRHAYFLGANDPYKSLKTTLKAEINEDAWATLNSDTSQKKGRKKKTFTTKTGEGKKTQKKNLKNKKNWWRGGRGPHLHLRGGEEGKRRGGEGEGGWKEIKEREVQEGAGEGEGRARRVQKRVKKNGRCLADSDSNQQSPSPHARGGYGENKE